MSDYRFIKLGKLTKIRTGKLDANASSEYGKYPFFTCSREPLKISSYSYECECVLVAGNGDLNVKYYNGKFDAYQRTYIIESLDKKKLFVPYLYVFLNKYVEKLREQAIGGVIKYIKLGNLTDAIIPLPPIEEQKKTAEILDKASNLISLRKKQIEKFDLLVKSRFVEMFGDPMTNPGNWKTVELAQCLNSIENGKSFNCDNYSRINENPAVLKLSAVTYGIYKSEENKNLPDKNLFLDKAEVKNGDLLFTRKNTYDLVGMCAYVFYTPPRLMMPDLIFRLNTKDNCNKIYLWQLINLDLFRDNIKSLASGSSGSMPNISKQRLLKLRIPLPPLELQNKFADFVQQINKQKLNLQSSLDKIYINYKALMQQYFGQ